MSVLGWSFILVIGSLLITVLTIFTPKIVAKISSEEGRSTTDKVIKNCLMVVLGIIAATLIILVVFINL